MRLLFLFSRVKYLETLTDSTRERIKVHGILVSNALARLRKLYPALLYTSMSSLGLLITDLQSLSSETRRKHPEIREAAEKSLTILRERASANDPDVLRPLYMGCASKAPKVVAISLGALQRLISMKAVPHSAVPLIVQTMSDAMSQGVDIQLRILQTLVSLIPNFPEIHDALLADALLLCFKLQESRIAVVSSTAAATLRQLLMFVLDKMVNELRLIESDSAQFDFSPVTLPDGSEASLGPSSKDAYCVFEDLCLLSNSEKSRFLRLESLHKTFALELVESVLTNYSEVFRNHGPLILLLRHHLCPLLLKTLSDRPLFPLTLRCTRVIFLLLKQFEEELSTESEVFLVLLVKIISEEDSDQPVWMRVIAMEIMRGICSDASLMRHIWARYDAEPDGSKVFTNLLTTLKRLLSEKPALLGVCPQIGGIGVSGDSQGDGARAQGRGRSMAGRVASATVSGVVGMMSSGEHGLSVQTSSMKLQCIDQLDKADSPPIPESYIFLLAVQCVTSLCEGLASYAGPIYSSLVIQRPRAAGEAAVRAPPALDLSTLPPDDPQTQQLNVVKEIIANGWPALLASLSLLIATNLSDELFVDVLASYQNLTNVSGMLGLTTPRDAFFNSLSRYAVPPRVVSTVDTYAEPSTPRTASVAVAEGLGLGGPPPQPPGLSERNMACLKVFIGSALFLAGSLGESWYAILETMQNADYVLSFRGGTAVGVGNAQPPSRTVPMAASTSQSHSGTGASSRHPLLSDLGADTTRNAIQRLFDSSKNLEDGAFKDFVDALCRLSKEMVGLQAQNNVGGGALSLLRVASRDSVADALPGALDVVQSDPSQRRRMSGMHIPKTQLQRNGGGDFGISKLGGVALLNIHRLIYRSPEVAWSAITSHLISIIRLESAPKGVRMQASSVLDEVMQVAFRNISSSLPVSTYKASPSSSPKPNSDEETTRTRQEVQADVQRRVLEVLAQQIIPNPEVGYTGDTNTGIELRKMGLETLHAMLQASGHALLVGWEIIFEMLGSVCRIHVEGAAAKRDSVSSTTAIKRSKPSALTLDTGTPSEKSYTVLVKIAFQSLTLVCDSVSLLSPSHLRLCITTLGQFGRQSDTNIALTAAASLLWSVSDAIQTRRKNVDEEKEFSDLWLFLLGEISGLCTDVRSEVRDGAVQTLFRAMGLYGHTLSAEMWNQCVWQITFPLLDAITEETRRRQVEVLEQDSAESQPQEGSHRGMKSSSEGWDESKILALGSIGNIFNDFLISKIMLLDSFTEAWDAFVTRIQDTVLVDNRPVSAPALRCLEKSIKAALPAEGVLKSRAAEMLDRAWVAVDVVGTAAARRATSPNPAHGTDSERAQHPPFTQESLVAFIDVIQCMRQVHGRLTAKEWELGKLTRMMAILKGVLTYPNSPDYRPDIDALPPVQDVVITTIKSIDLSISGAPSLVMRDLSEYATLAFLAAFDVQPPLLPGQQSPGPQKRVSYIALAKKVMPMLVDLFLRFKNEPMIYVDGTLEAVLSAYSIPIKLKYDCPAPSKFGKDEQLWKTATTCFLRIVKESTIILKTLDSELSDERIEGIWRQILDVFRGAILADCSPAESFSLGVQEAEEDFDLALITSLETDVVPHLGDSRVPDILVSQVSKVLKQGSQIYDSDDEFGSKRRLSTSESSKSAGSDQTDVTKVDVEEKHSIGSTDFGLLLPRERFSYHCFDLLFLICSGAATGDDETSRKRLAALSLPSLLARIKTTLVSYVADESLRGDLPFPRAREEELLYVLRNLLKLRLWPGSLWAATSDDPTRYASSQPSAFERGLSTPSELIADSIKHTSIAHLFHFFPALCEIASIPNRTPNGYTFNSFSVPPNSPGARTSAHVTGLDARTLARDCLKEVGKGMGVSRVCSSGTF